MPKDEPEEICGEIPQESCHYEPRKEPVESCHIEPKNDCQVIQEYIPVQKCRNISEVIFIIKILIETLSFSGSVVQNLYIIYIFRLFVKITQTQKRKREIVNQMGVKIQIYLR